MGQFKISLEKISKQLHFDVVYSPCDLKDIFICTADLNRPGLLLAGYDQFFESSRMQVLGNAETGYLKTLSEEKRKTRLEKLVSGKPPAIIVTHGIQIDEILIDLAKEYEVAILSTAENTTVFISNMNSYLSVELAERITRHGVLVEVYGEGILIMGDSGVGKSETAVELVKRGHRLIADDAVELRRVSNRTIVGSAPENIRHFIELRGVGIINVARVFGSGAVKVSEKIDLIVHLEPWDKTKTYNRTGLESDTTEILGIDIASTVIPVMPGRNLAVILEAASINNRQKKMGYNAAKELMGKLGYAFDE